MQQDDLRVMEIIRRIPGCSTEPFLCKCDDDKLYVVKGMPCTTRKQLIAELISAYLGQNLGLPLPEFRLAYVDKELTQYIPEFRRDLQEGYAFASRFIPGVNPITFSQAHSNICELEQKTIYLFDKWINNSDRTLSPFGGNVNIIFDNQNNRYFIIDHNLAFDQDTSDTAFDCHVYAPQYRSWVFDIIDKPQNEDKLASAKSLLPDFLSKIPEEWMPEDNNEAQVFLSFIEDTLNRIEQEVFWRSIT